jgi:hypothetical protein
VRNQSEPVEASIVRRLAGWQTFHVFTLAIICLLCGTLAVFGQTFASSPREAGRISGVRTVLRRTILSTARYSGIHEFDVYFSLRTGQETYCADYETVVLDEIQDLTNSQGRDLQISLDKKRNRVVLYSMEGRKLKARIVRPNLCESVGVSYSAFH